MLPKVLCFFAIAALVAAAPYSEDDSQYIDQLQKEYEDDKYDDTQTDEFGKIEDMQQQFQDEDEQNSQLKDIEQFESEEDKQESTEHYEDTNEDIGQVEYGTENDKDLEQAQHATEDDKQEIEDVDQDTGYKPSNKIEQSEEDGEWNQIDDNNDNVGDDTIHFKEDPDDVESDSAIGKLFGDSTGQEQEGKYGDDEDQQQAEVDQEHTYEEQLPVEEVVPSPSYKSNYGSEYSGVYQPSESFEPEVYTQKTPWYKRFWGKTKETAKGIAHKVKETFRGK